MACSRCRPPAAWAQIEIGLLIELAIDLVHVAIELFQEALKAQFEGDYRLEFLDPSGAYEFVFYSNAAVITRANDVHVVLEKTTTGVNQALRKAAKKPGPTSAPME